MFVFGTLMGLPGALLTLPDVVDGFQLTLADRGTLIASLFAGLCVGSALSGPMAEVMGTRRAFVVSSVLVAVCLPLIGFATGLWSAAAALAAAGVPAAGINTTANALVSDAFPAERGHRLAIVSVAVGAGGLVMPAAAAAIAGQFSWTVLVFGAAVLAAAVAVATFRLEAPASAAGAHVTLADTMELLRQPGFVSIILLVLLGAGTDVTMAGWTSTYLIERGFEPRSAAWALSSYWFGLIAGRLALSRYVDRDKARAIALAAGASAACVLLLVLSSGAVLAAMPFVTGAAIALLVPTALALGGERFSANTGMVFGVMLTAAQVGATVLPALVGVVAESAGLRTAMALLVVNGVIIVGVAIAARR
jgi:fucose permease